MSIRPDKICSTFLGKEVPEVFTVQTVADSSKSLAGKSYHFTTTDGVTDYKYRPWYCVAGTGENPLLGKKEQTTFTNRADSSGDLASKYFKLADGPSTGETKYYCYFTVAGAGYDPGLGVAEVTDVTTVADSSGSLDGTYWTLRDGDNGSFYVWYAVIGKTNTDPAPGGTGIKVVIKENASIHEVRIATRDTLNAIYTEKWEVVLKSTAQITVTNKVKGAVNDAAAGTSGFTVTVTTQGVTGLQKTGQALEGYTLLCEIPVVAQNDADEVVALAMTNAINGVSGWSASQQAPTNDHKVDVTHKTKGNCTNAADGNVGGVFAATVLVSGIDPVSNEIALKVDIDENETANNVAEKTLLAIRADPVLNIRLKVSRSTDTLTCTNRRGGVVADAANVDAGFTVGVTTQGNDTFTTDMVVTSAAEFWYKPPEGKVLSLRTIVLTGTQADVTDASKFLSLTALTNGCTIDVCDKDGTVIKALSPGLLKKNADMAAMGFPSIVAGTVDLFQVAIPLLTSMADDIQILGSAGEYIRFKVNDDLTGVTTFTCNIWGYLSDAATIGV